MLAEGSRYNQRGHMRRSRIPHVGASGGSISSSTISRWAMPTLPLPKLLRYFQITNNQQQTTQEQHSSLR
jgi:hypothetical protein